MLDRVGRAEAVGIARGTEPLPDQHSKIVLYGLLGRALEHSQADPLFADDDGVDSLHDFHQLLKLRLAERALDGFDALDEETRIETEELFLERSELGRELYGDEPASKALFTQSRLKDGASSGARRQVATLRTIKMLTERNGNPEPRITITGLYASYRVPFQLALLHLAGLDGERELQHEWLRTDGGDGELVLGQGSVGYSAENGLFIRGLPDFEINPISPRFKAKHGPRIGCPASFLDGYIEDIHRQSADFVMRSGLIVPQGST